MEDVRCRIYTTKYNISHQEESYRLTARVVKPKEPCRGRDHGRIITDSEPAIYLKQNQTQNT